MSVGLLYSARMSHSGMLTLIILGFPQAAKEVRHEFAKDSKGVMPYGLDKQNKDALRLL